MKRNLSDLLIALTGLLLIGCAGSAGRAGPPTPTIDAHLRQLAAEFKTLRATKGQFNGAEWNADVDQWTGRKHSLLIELGQSLSSGYDRVDVIRLLDPPDRIVRSGDSLFDMIRKVPGYDAPGKAAAEYLVYYWRGEHDFLFFECQGDAVVSSDWWYAGE